jgi:hypothetical protein
MSQASRLGTSGTARNQTVLQRNSDKFDPRTKTIVRFVEIHKRVETKEAPACSSKKKFNRHIKLEQNEKTAQNKTCKKQNCSRRMDSVINDTCLSSSNLRKPTQITTMVWVGNSKCHKDRHTGSGSKEV